MLPDPKTARIIRLERQALDALFENLKALAIASRIRRLEIVLECRSLMDQFRVVYAERRRRSSHTDGMLRLLDAKIAELAESESEPGEGSRCGVCSSLLETTGIGTFCSPCLDQLLPFYDWLESENESFSRTGRRV